jgi:nucleotide-binding universal stress UspA family protein
VRILVGIDYSEGSARALHEARALAAKLGGELVGLHVVESFRRDGDGRAAAGRAREARPGAVGFEGRVEVRQGFAWMELVRYAREIDPVMIVVGSHGASGFQPLALGSTAARLGVLSPYPVLVVTASEGRVREGRMHGLEVVRREGDC